MFWNVEELSSFDSGKQFLKANNLELIEKYAVCTKCYSLYNINSYAEKHEGETYSKEKMILYKIPESPSKTSVKGVWSRIKEGYKDSIW